MPHLIANGVRLHYELSGAANRPVVVFSNSLGTTLHMWDEVAAEVAKTYRVLRYDTRGHGGSQTVNGPASIDDLADDLQQWLADQLERLQAEAREQASRSPFGCRWPCRYSPCRLPCCGFSTAI